MIRLRLLPGLPVSGWQIGEERAVSEEEARILHVAYPGRFVEVRDTPTTNRMIHAAQVTKWH